MLTTFFGMFALGFFACMLKMRQTAAIAGTFLLFALITRALSVFFLGLVGLTFF